MFDFKEKKLYPLVRATKAQIDSALQKETAAERFEALCAAKQTMQDNVNQITKPMMVISAIQGVGVVSSGLACVFLVFASPVALAAFSVPAALLAIRARGEFNQGTLYGMKDAANEAIDEKLSDQADLILQENEEAFLKSGHFSKSILLVKNLMNSFNENASGKEFENLVSKAEAAVKPQGLAPKP